MPQQYLIYDVDASIEASVHAVKNHSDILNKAKDYLIESMFFGLDVAEKEALIEKLSINQK